MFNPTPPKRLNLEEALEELRKNELKIKVTELKSKLPHVGRCSICTLRVPCQHFSSIHQIPRTPVPELQPSYTAAALKKLKLIPKISLNSSIRSSSNNRQSSLPTEKRLKQLETLESFREEKLKKEMRKIQQLRDQAELERKQQMEEDNTKVIYMKKQKERVRQYQAEFEQRKEIVFEAKREEQIKKRKKENKRKMYFDAQRARLEDYYQKKEILKKISREKVMELQEEIINCSTLKLKNL